MEQLTEPPPQGEKAEVSVLPYTVIARRFRPQMFSAVVGQRAVVTTLCNSLRQGRVAHAYLFCGPRGTGKTTLARILAKALNCDTPPASGEPCGTCTSCVEIACCRSLDVLEIDGASNRGIDDIRQINETVSFAPAAGRWKIYIIDEVHMLTKEAFNALLKTLEEPPSRVKFFLATTEYHKIPSTIISRCQRFDLGRLSEEEIAGKLSTICTELQQQFVPQALLMIAHLAEGSLRDAESLLDQIMSCTEGVLTSETVSHQLGHPPQHFFFALDMHFAQGDASFAFTLVQELIETGCDLGVFLEKLAEHYRLLLLLQYDTDALSGPAFCYFDLTTRQQFARSSPLYTREQCLSILDILVEWLPKMPHANHPRILLEVILSQILRSKNRVSIEAVIRRLIALEATLSLPVGSTSSPPSIQQKPDTTIPGMITESRVSGAPHLTHRTETMLPMPSEKTQEDVEAPPCPSTTSTTPPLQTPIAETYPGRFETILRFASVELEGIVKKPIN